MKKGVKKILSIVLVIGMVTSLTGCKEGESKAEEDKEQVEETLVSDQVETEKERDGTVEANMEEEPIKLLIQEDLPSLYEVYKDDFKVGVAIPLSFVTDENMKALLTKHFNSFTAENSMKPAAFLNAGNKEKLQFLTGDMFTSFAKDSGIGLRGHTLIWHQQTPTWFYREDYKDNGPVVDKEVMLSRMENYIKEIMTHYKDSNIYAWDVINEVIDTDQVDNMRDSLWYQILGDDLVVKAFEYARKYSQGTDVKLFYNDYNIVASVEKRMAIYEMVKDLKEKGLIDGVGLQAHINYQGPGVAEFEDTIELFGSLGLEVHITELDISLYSENTDTMNGDEDYQNRLLEQAYLYQDLFELFRKHKDVVTSVTIWSITDNLSWLNTFPVRRTNWPVLFDKNYQAKDSFYGLVDKNYLPKR